MIGHNESNASPKILICSTDSKTRKDIRKLIKDSKIMERYPGIGLGDVSALPDRHVIRELSREAIEAILPPGCGIDGAVLAYGSRPVLGKRIFIVNPHDFSLRPTTAGPIILRDGRCYQLAVAHAFRHTRDLGHSSGQQTAEDDCDFDGMSDVDESEYDEITRKGSATPGEIDSDKASFMASLDAVSSEKHSSSRSESPPSDHLDSGNNPQPSIESTEDNPVCDESDVSQLQYFGKLISSSLTGNNPSLDYALIEITSMGELERFSLIASSLVWSIGEIWSDDIDIVATTWRQDRIKGRLTATPSYIRLPEQHTFQQVYPVRLGKPLNDGDCGTPVFCEFGFRFYGHIVAGGPGTGIAYIVPAREISRDMQNRLGFGLRWESHKDEQRSKYDFQLDAGLSPDSTKPGETSNRNASASEIEQLRRGQLRESNTDRLPSQDWSTNSASSVGPQTRSVHTASTAPSGQQFRWSPQTDTDASSVSDTLPKLQTSRSVRKHLLSKRPIYEHVSRALSHTSLAVYAAQPPLSLVPGYEIQETQNRKRDIWSFFPNSGTGSSSAQPEKAAGKLASRLVLPEDFKDACETCFFWMYSPDHFSSVERHACSGRKEEISHIITHAINQHGLVRGRDPKNPSRKYLASCQTHDPLVKAKGDCTKCSSLHEWNDGDFADPKHDGAVVCLRCWCKFGKQEMKEHIDGPLCDYNSEQPKAKRLWVLYTAFCSETQLPSRPPRNMPPRKLRKSSHPPSPREIAQQPFGRRPRATPLDDLDATTPLLGEHNFLPLLSIHSHVPSTAEGPLRSPNLDEPEWLLPEDAHDMDIESSWLDAIGSHPLLEPSFEAGESLPRQTTNRHQHLAPESELPADQQASAEKDSGYYTAKH
jgi:hypothetical protein